MTQKVSGDRLRNSEEMIVYKAFSSNRAAIIALRVVMVGIPVLFLFHSVTWHSIGVSSSTAVYAMKIFAVITLIPLLMRGVIYAPNDRGFLTFNLLVALIFFSSFITVMWQDYFSLFYFLADSLGFLLFCGYAQFGYMLRAKYSYVPSAISKELNVFLILISIVIILGFIQSGGQKVSIPPDMHFATIFCFLCFFLRESKLSMLTGIFFVLLVSVSAFLTLHKVSLGAIGFSFVYLLIYRLRNFSIKNVAVVLFLVLTFLFIVFNFGSNLLNEFSVEINDAGDGFVGGSANQRILESLLIFDEMAQSSYLTQILGKGFGSHYFNPGIIEHYPDYVHQGHSTPFILWLRNGVLGVSLFAFIAIYSFRSLFSKNPERLIFAAPLFYCCLASLVDLYIYWGFFMGFGTGLLLAQAAVDKRLRKTID